MHSVLFCVLLGHKIKRNAKKRVGVLPCYRSLRLSETRNVPHISCKVYADALFFCKENRCYRDAQRHDPTVFTTCAIMVMSVVCASQYASRRDARIGSKTNTPNPLFASQRDATLKRFYVKRNAIIVMVSHTALLPTRCLGKRGALLGLSLPRCRQVKTAYHSP